MANEKNQTTNHNLSDFESDSQDTHYQSSMNLANKLDGARVALTLLALLVGITILGLSADALAVYNSTQLPGGDSSFLLSLWPADLNLRPTVALVAGSAVVTAINIVSLLVSKVKVLRHRVMIHTPMTFIAPLFGFIAAMVAMAYFYAVNASDIEDTMQSWSCRWTAVQMTQKPHFATLCRQSKAGLYLAIILIPIEGIVFAVAAVQAGLERKASSGGRRSKTASPVLN